MLEGKEGLGTSEVGCVSGLVRFLDPLRSMWRRGQCSTAPMGVKWSLVLIVGGFSPSHDVYFGVRLR